MKHNDWHLRPEDIDWNWHDKKINSMFGAELTIIHKMSELKVVGEIKPGRFSRSEMQGKKRTLYNSLMEQLEEKVQKEWL